MTGRKSPVQLVRVPTLVSVAVLAAFAAGVIVGMALGTPSPAGALGVVGPRERTAVDDALDRPAALEPAPAGGSPAPEEQPAAAGTVAGPRRRLPDGQSLVEVLVVDDAGTPVAGAEVEVREAYEDDAPDDDPDQVVSEHLRIEGGGTDYGDGVAGEELLASGGTADDGRFGFVIGTGRRVWVTAAHLKRPLRGWQLVIPKASECAVTVTLRPSCVREIAGVIRSRDGRPIAGATIRAGWEEGDPATAVSGSDGRYVVPLGAATEWDRIVVTIEARGFGSATAEFGPRWSGPARQGLDAILDAVALVRGRIHMRGGGSVPDGVRVHYVVDGDHSRSHWAYPVDGAFQIELRTGGEVSLRAVGLEVRHAMQRAGTVEVGEELEVVLEVDRVATARIEIRDPDGLRIERGGHDRLPHQHRLRAWLVESNDPGELPAYGTGSRLWEPMRRLPSIQLPIEADGTIRVPLTFDGPRWLVVAGGDMEQTPARVKIAPSDLPAKVSLRRLLVVLQAPIEIKGGGRLAELKAAGRWDDGVETGPFLLQRVRGESGKTVVRIVRPDTGRAVRGELRLELLGYPAKRWALAEASGGRLPVNVLRFERD